MPQLIIHGQDTVSAESPIQIVRRTGDVAYETAVPIDGAALDITYPSAGSVIRRTALLENVDARGPYRQGIKVTRAWNSRIYNAMIEGALTLEEYQNPQAMRAGVQLVGCMDAVIRDTCVTSADVGISVQSDPEGHPRSEGLDIQSGFLMHVNRGVEVFGSIGGGWPTPSTLIAPRHIAFNQTGIVVASVAMLTIRETNLYAESWSKGGWGIHLVNCRDVQIFAPNFWANWTPEQMADPAHSGYGCIAMVNCHNVEIWGGTTTPGVRYSYGIWARQCSNITTHGRIWDEFQKAGKNSIA